MYETFIHLMPFLNTCGIKHCTLKRKNVLGKDKYNKKLLYLGNKQVINVKSLYQFLRKIFQISPGKAQMD